MSNSAQDHASATADPTADVVSRQVLQTSRSWIDAPYESYPTGAPQLTVVRYSIPPHSSLAWHTHVVPNTAYVIEGALTVEDRESGRTQVVQAGEAFGESVGSVHRGYTEDEQTEVVAVYAGADGVDLSIPAE